MVTWLDFCTSNTCETFTKSVQQQNIWPEYELQAKCRPEIGIIFLYLAIYVYSILENERKRYFKYHQVDKRIYIIVVGLGHKRLALIGLYIDRERRV